jgi:hypothetical protein
MPRVACQAPVNDPLPGLLPFVINSMFPDGLSEIRAVVGADHEFIGNWCPPGVVAAIGMATGLWAEADDRYEGS